eukprot:TRINITY_DN2749_c0_g2_i1.p1 TRINITY_DN2749_c0_g2~~TRINITY_DN2749_c0_g2_i1.p1  ORF type:complete len:401 (+),score=138.43 TRINITY_DN2749_c0_g2_i1:1-1203(+)
MIDMNRLNDIERRINEIEHFKEKKSEKENFKTFKNLEKFNDFKEDDEKKYFMIDNMFNEMFYFNMIMPGAIKDLNNARNKCMQILYSLMKIFDHSTTKFDEYIAKHMHYDNYLKNLIEILQKYTFLKKSISNVENEEGLNEIINECFKLQRMVESLQFKYQTVVLKVECNFSKGIEEIIDQRRNELSCLKVEKEKEKIEKQNLSDRIDRLERIIELLLNSKDTSNVGLNCPKCNLDEIIIEDNKEKGDFNITLLDSTVGENIMFNDLKVDNLPVVKESNSTQLSDYDLTKLKSTIVDNNQQNNDKLFSKLSKIKKFDSTLDEINLSNFQLQNENTRDSSSDSESYNTFQIKERQISFSQPIDEVIGAVDDPDDETNSQDMSDSEEYDSYSDSDMSNENNV